MRSWMAGTRGWPATLLVAAIGLVSCGGGAGGSAADDPDRVGGDLLVFAAASLADAFAEIEIAFEAAHPDVDVSLNLAGSSSLRAQILEGAPADVFASAGTPVMDEVQAAGEIGTEPAAFARNRLVIAVPAGNPGEVDDLEDLADEGLLVGLCAEGVPCGDLARDVLAAAGVAAAPDTYEPDVRALLTRIVAGELDAGLVYLTDARSAEDAVEVVALPRAADLTTEYPIATLAEAPNATAAAAFVEFVLSQPGRAVLADLGFTVP